MVLVSDKPSTILVFYRLNPAIERGTKPDALGWKPCHWTRILKTAMVNARVVYSNSAVNSIALKTGSLNLSQFVEDQNGPAVGQTLPPQFIVVCSADKHTFHRI